MNAITTNSFLFGVITSLAATILWQLLGYFTAFIPTPLDLVASIAGGGVVRQYTNFQQCEKDLKKAIGSTKSIRFMAIRGFAMTQETYALFKILEDDYQKTKTLEIKVLLADPEAEEALLRAKEFCETSIENTDTYLLQIKNSINMITDMSALYPKTSLRLHSEPAIFRVLLTDDWCFVGFYTKKLKGHTSPVLKISRKGIFFDAFDRYFDKTWLRSAEGKHLKA